jgi:hypothetical protein
MVAPPIALQIDTFVKYRARTGTPSVGETVSVIGPIWGYGVALRWIGLLTAKDDTFFERIEECKKSVLDYLSSRKVPFPATVDEVVGALSSKYPTGNIAFALGELFDERTPAFPFFPRRAFPETIADYMEFRGKINAPATISEVLTIFAPSWGVLDTLKSLYFSFALIEGKTPDTEKTYGLLKKYLKKRKCPFHPTVDEVYDYLLSERGSAVEAIDAILEAYYDGFFFTYLQPTFEGGANGDEGTGNLLC